MQAPRLVFLLGGPGSGKGTQAKLCAQRANAAHLSAGDLLRAEASRENGCYTKLINDDIRAGRIVPAEITVQLLKTAIEREAAAGKGLIIIDGFPRAIDQYECFRSIIGPVDRMVFLECPDSILEKRLLERGKFSGRIDDNVDSIRARLVVFHDQTEKIVRLFDEEGKLRRVRSDLSVEEVYREFERAVSP